MHELIEVLRHILHEIDADPNADPGEILDAIDWERVRRVLSRQKIVHALGGGTVNNTDAQGG